MNRFAERLKAFNTDWNDLPRRAALALLLFAALLLAAKVFVYVAPFVFAALLAWLINRPVRALAKLLGGGHKGRRIASAVLVALFSALLLSLLLLIAFRIVAEIKAFAAALPGLIQAATDLVTGWINALNLDRPALAAQLVELLSGLGAQLASLATGLASSAAMAAFKTVSWLPSAMLFAVLVIAGAYYFSADPERIASRIRSLLPETVHARSLLLRAGVLKCIVSQVRAAALMLCITFLLLSLGFIVLRLEYALALAGIISLLDALPVIGAGLFLLPGAAYFFFTGAWVRGAGFLLLHLITVVARQMMEPRLVGRQLGLHPLSTMMAMYAGLRALGIVGMIIGPLLLLIGKVALTVDPKDLDEFSRPLRPLLVRRSRPPEAEQTKKNPPKQE